MLGPHLTLDIYNCNKKKLSDEKLILFMLNELPDLLGMHKICEPQIVNYGGNAAGFDKGGISAYVIIAESHIAIHTWRDQKFASIDIFSCKEFNVEQTRKYFLEKLSGKKFEQTLTMRGKDFPKDIKKSNKLATVQRKTINSHFSS